jgi:hypothetical protein
MMRNNRRLQLVLQLVTALVLVALTITTGVVFAAVNDGDQNPYLDWDFAAFLGLAEAEDSAPTLTPVSTSASTAAQVCPSRNISDAPYPASRFICGVGFQKSSHRREAPGSDNWPVTWADDNNQYTAWGDGGGFGGTNSDGRTSLGVARVSGDFDSYRGKNVWGGKNPENPAQFGGKSYAIISIDGVLYMMVTPGSGTTGFNYIEVARSTNNSRTWQKANFRWNKSEGLIKPAFLQFGRDYAGARDDFVYVYMIGLEDDSGLVVQKPGRIYLLRVPKTEVFGSKSNYQYFNGLNSSGDPIWSDDISDKEPVFEDSNGVGWTLAVSYNAGLNRYLLTTEHDRSFRANLGIFDAPTPWGPWTTASYDSNWQGFREGSRGPFYWNFSNKWLRNSGRDFTLVFTGGPGGGIDSWNTINGSFTTP